MASFNYQDIREVYENVLESNTVFYPIIGTKILCVIVVVISLYNKYLTSLKPDKEGAKHPFSTSDMVFYSLIVLSVVFYDGVLSMLDGALGSIENQFIANVGQGVNLNTITNTTVTHADKNDSWMDAIKSMSKTVGEFFNDPLIIVLWICKSLAWLITTLAYGVVVAERFFFLGLLRVIGALALSCLAIKQLSKWFWSWLGLYVATYLLIIPYFLVDLFTTALHDKFMLKFKEIDSSLGVNGSSSVLGATLIIFLAFVQLRVYKRSADILMRIFS